MNQYTFKGANGLFFVNGQGFAAQSRCAGSKLTAAQIKCLRESGFAGTEEAIKTNKSYAVNYVRAKNLDGTGGVETDKRNPSKRRFASFAEAKQHGSRFNVRVSKQGDKPGTAGHIGFYITETTDEVNSKVNWETGLTNSL